MTETPGIPFNREVILRTPRKYDLEIHVCKVTLDDAAYADIREYVPSISQYGRGIVLPKGSLRGVIAALNSLADEDE